MTTRDRLIDSTRELLWERGYVGTSPRAIQERAGAGQGSMYYHFTGKPDLALAAVTRSAAELRTLAGAALSGPGTAVDRIAAYLRREREVLRRRPDGPVAADPGLIFNPEVRPPLQGMFAPLRGPVAQVLPNRPAARGTR